MGGVVNNWKAVSCCFFMVINVETIEKSFFSSLQCAKRRKYLLVPIL